MVALSSIEKRVKNQEAIIASSLPRSPDLFVNFDDYTITYKTRSDTGAVVTSQYLPFPTTTQFHRDKSLVKLIMGPFGSGKSSACLSEIVFHSSGMPMCKDGVRRSRVAIVRNTYDMLKDTCLQSFLMWWGFCGIVDVTYKPIRARWIYYDQFGRVECTIVFLAMDKPDQLQALFSNEFSMAYVNESQFIEERVVELLMPRVGRYPKKDQIINPDNRRFKQIVMDTNPPDEDHWLYRWFEIDKIPDYSIFKQPPGLIKNEFGVWIENPFRENNDGLDLTYYTDNARGKSTEWINVYCLGNYGLMKDGKLVHPNFSADMHVYNDGIDPNPKLPLDLGFDFGLTPACVIEQVDSMGRVYGLHEVCSFEMDLVQMLDNLLMPLLSTKFKGYKINISCHDPAGLQRVQTDGQTCHDILKQYGLNPMPAETNDIGPRIRAVNKQLDRNVVGRPGYILDGKNCPMLKKAFLKEYKYRRLLVSSANPHYADKPDKNDFSHIMDAKQYISVYRDQNWNKEPVRVEDYMGVNQEWGF